MNAAVVEHEKLRIETVSVERSPTFPRWFADVSTQWRDVLADPCLRDLPYKVETNRAGQLIISPAKNQHGILQMRIGRLLETSLGSQTIAECAIATPQGVKVADVAWGSASFFHEHEDSDLYVVAPEICVEIESPSNAESELQSKVRLYLDAGAREVWLVEVKGRVRVFGPEGARASSTFAVDIANFAYPVAGEHA